LSSGCGKLFVAPVQGCARKPTPGVSGSLREATSQF